MIYMFWLRFFVCGDGSGDGSGGRNGFCWIDSGSDGSIVGSGGGGDFVRLAVEVVFVDTSSGDGYCDSCSGGGGGGAGGKFRILIFYFLWNCGCGVVGWWWQRRR